MISRGMMNRQLYANGPGIMGLQAEMRSPFEPTQNPEQEMADPSTVVQQAINTLARSLNLPVEMIFKYVVDTLKEVPPEMLRTGGANLIIEKTTEKIRAGKKPGAVQPEIEDLLKGQPMTEDDIAVMEDLEEKQRIMNEQEQQYADEEGYNYAKGGIVNLRQGYFVGGIVKSIGKAVKGAVKGATKAVKSIVSSDIGKLALLAAGGYYLGGGTFGGMFTPFSQTTLGSSAFGQAIANPFVKAGQFLQSPSSFFTKGKTFGVDYGGQSLLKTPVKDLISQGYTMEEIAKIQQMSGTGGGILSGKNLLSAASILGPSILAGASVEEESTEDALAKQRAERDALVQAEYRPLRQRLGPAYQYAADGGIMRTKYAMGSDMPMGNPRVNQAGTPELDYRQEGGFVPPIGIKEKEDDIPAMLSNNEFVFTAEAVGGADPLGEGDRGRGAEAMYALMKKLEGKGAMA